MRRLLIRAAMRLLPGGFRERFGPELIAVIASISRDVRAKAGRRAELAYLFREAVAFVQMAIAARRLSPSVMPEDAGARMSVFSGIITDVRWSARQARRRPLQTAAVAATLALTIAAATTAHGLADAVLWRPLPFREATRLVFVWERDRDSKPMRVTAARYAAWRDAATSLESIAVFGAAGFTIEESGGNVSVRGVRVSSGYFETLGLAPVLGRSFSPADEVAGQHQVVILAHAFWQQRFGGRAEAIGATLRLSGSDYTIVGVMPSVVQPGWPVNPASVTIDADARQLWVPIARTSGFEQNARSHVFGVIARLASGMSIEQASQEINRLETAGAPDPHGAWLTPLREQFVHDARLPLLLLLGAAAAVLLIACTNLAAINVTAFEARRREFAIRVAIGARFGRLVRQLIVEALLLAILGGVLGTAISGLALATLPQLLPPSVPMLTSSGLEGRAIGFASGVSLLTALTLAAWPILRLRSFRGAPRAAAGEARNAIYRALVVGQISITVALVATAGLLAQSLWSVRHVDPGFVVDGVLVADIRLPGSDPRPELTAAAEQRIREAVARLLRTTSVAVAYDHPLESNWTDAYRLSGEDGGVQDAPRQAELRIVSPSYFEALGVELLDGRTFADSDALATAGVALVNEALAREVGGRVIGRRLRTQAPRLNWGTAVPAQFAVIGVIENERFRGLERGVLPAVYLSTRQFPLRTLSLLVRSRGQPRDRSADLRAAVRAVEPQATVGSPTSLANILSEQLITRRVTTDLVSGLAAVALALAALGLYGMLAVLVARRARDIGIRLALGAPLSAIRRSIVGESVGNAAAGTAIGLVLAIVAGRLFRSLLVGVAPHDPLTLAAVAITLMCVATAAALVPARRASRVDPLVALRQE